MVSKIENHFFILLNQPESRHAPDHPSRAASEIRQAVDDSRSRHIPSPFFFLVGAGNFTTLNSALVLDRRALPSRWLASTSATWICRPIQWGATQPRCKKPIRSRRERDYLSRLVKDAIISQANFRLAHLLLNQSVASLAVTPNFDNLLSRALVLFGELPVVCDHSQTVARIELMDQTTVQILHVHGTYAFYDCCNLTAEIVARAQPSADTSYTVPGVLDAVLQNYSPTVVGYSGWRGDVIMSALERRLRAALKNKIYWFCFRRPHAAELPEWLKDNPNVSLVVPDGPVRAEESAVLQEPTRMKGTAATTDEVSLSASGIRDIGKDI